VADTAADVARWVRAVQAEMAEHKDRLTALDAAIGDADHGTNMDRGMRAAAAKVDGLGEEADIAQVLKTVGMTLVSTVGGAAGPLYGTLFLRMGTAAAGKEALDAAGWADALAAGVGGVPERGKAVPGDKTMVDALLPAAAAFRTTVDRGGSAAEAWHRAAVAARAGTKATIPMVARKGRASYLGERSAGHQDPGATSSYLLVECGAEVLGGVKAESR
jgi:phosphoenolpyruvate---glycerone phosphotransferase subunit DhaL